jgi:hypothetical protein
VSQVEGEIEEEVAHGKSHIEEMLEEHRKHTMEHGGDGRRHTMEGGQWNKYRAVVKVSCLEDTV